MAVRRIATRSGLTKRAWRCFTLSTHSQIVEKGRQQSDRLDSVPGISKSGAQCRYSAGQEASSAALGGRIPGASLRSSLFWNLNGSSSSGAEHSLFSKQLTFRSKIPTTASPRYYYAGKHIKNGPYIVQPSSHYKLASAQESSSPRMDRVTFHSQSPPQTSEHSTHPPTDASASANAEPPHVSIADWQVEMDAQETMWSTLGYLERFTNHERKGVPKGAGTDSGDGFPLRRMDLLMERLGNPVAQLKVVHVAGTKGKGSVVALLAACLRKAQLKVGTYTSPHFLTVRERIAIDGIPISPNAFAALVAAHKPILEDLKETEGVTHFEVLTALAFKHFEEAGVDIAIIEAGLGGARDATNVIPASSLLLAVLTAIHEEHLEALGGSLETIVQAKCGIIKEGRPVLLAAQKFDIVGAIEAAAQAKRAVLHRTDLRDAERIWRSAQATSSQDSSTEESGDPKRVGSVTSASADVDKGVGEEVRSSEKEFRGGVLWENAATAFKAAEIVLSQVSRTIEPHAVTFPPLEALPPGRMQKLKPEEAEKLGLGGKRVILDGAHTPESFSELCQALAEFAGDPTVLFVIAMARDKDHRKCLEQISRGPLNLQTPIFTKVPVAGSFERSTPAETLAECWTELGKESPICEPNFDKAMERAADAPIDVMVCLAGSMHLVGAALGRIAGLEPKVKR